MRTKLLHSDAGQRTHVVVLETGDEIMACLQQVARAERLSAAQITAIGAFSDATLMFFDWEAKDYRRIPVRDQVEVAALNGDVALGEDDAPMLHIHVVLGRRDGSALAGHLAEGHVRPTLEVLITDSPAHLRRRKDPESGLPLIRPEG